jgi:hypothetical protein
MGIERHPISTICEIVFFTGMLPLNIHKIVSAVIKTAFPSPSNDGTKILDGIILLIFILESFVFINFIVFPFNMQLTNLHKTTALTGHNERFYLFEWWNASI